ncbi:MAG: lysylphosphatidylglycerol synthase transmembrane domain-containing protein [Alphaproteobacteria bacterium]
MRQLPSDKKNLLRQRFLTAAKLAVSTVLIYWVFRKFDFGEAWIKLEGIRATTILVVFGLSAVQVALLGLRWTLICRWWNSKFAQRHGFSTLFAGLFFGQAMPSSIGGDAIRAFLLFRRYRFSISEAILATLVDRAVGLVALLLLATLFAPSYLALYDTELGILGWQGAATVAALVGLGLLALIAFRIAARAGFWPRVLGKILRALPVVRKAELVPAFVLGALSHFALLVSAFIWFSEISPGIPISAFFVLAPIGLLLSALPISIGGWGVRETSLVFLFTRIDVPAADALLLGLGIGLLSLAQGLVCGTLWASAELLRRDRNSDFVKQEPRRRYLPFR